MMAQAAKGGKLSCKKRCAASKSSRTSVGSVSSMYSKTPIKKPKRNLPPSFPGGLVFDVARTGRDFEDARQEFWQAQGKLSRTIGAAKALDKPRYEALDLQLSDAVGLIEWPAAILNKDEIEEWVATNKLWEQTLVKFNI